MQKKNSVIKNYILSPKKRVLEKTPPLKKIQYITVSETWLYHSPSMPYKDCLFLFLLRK